MPPRKKPAAPDGAAPAAKKPAARPRKSAAAPAEKSVARGPATSRAPADGAASQDLVIVESPAKANTINKYLGPRFKVMASYGHVRDLPTRRVGKQAVAGVDIANGWKLNYVVADKKDKDGGAKFKRRTAKEILAELGREAQKSGRVLLATDPDREGEAIAWHIKDELGLEDDRTFRITFNEITRTAVQNALTNPAKINMDRVSAQEARRAVDRVVGFPLSNLLARKTHNRELSAGRVQSVAVRMIVDRELEIAAFKSEEYWKITALLAPPGTVTGYTADPARSKILAKKAPAPKADAQIDDKGEESAAADEKAGLPTPPAGSFLAELIRWDGAEFKAGNEQQADATVAALQGADYVVSRVEQKDRQDRPQAPFTTSTLQQQANIRLGMAAQRTMSTAQRLYEGVPLGSEGSVALITYMRTDSTRVSADALRMVRDHIGQEYGQRYLPAQPNSYSSGKSAQEAHEAVRPTDVAYTPDRVAKHLDRDQLRLYTLIYNRFVASQMAPAVLAVTTVDVTAAKGLFRATGQVTKFDGYRRVMPPSGKQEGVTLPTVSEKQKLDRLDLFSSQHFTKPPSRYNEASLVKALEKEGIGRPSTYATIINVIQKRGYVEQQSRRFFATPLGMSTTKMLIDSVPRVMDLKFTARMEDDLDRIETREVDRSTVLDEFWGWFENDLKEADKKLPQQGPKETGEKCPKCGRPLLEMINRKKGNTFIGCSGYREKENPCKFVKPREGETGPRETDVPCPACGKMMIEREGKKGIFLGCSGYPECKTTMNIGEDGKPVLSAVPTTHTCEKCGSAMVKRDSKRGPFLACTGYPKCKNALDLDADGNPIKPVDPGIACEKCNKPMRIQKSWRGPFLSCSGYPGCRNAKPISAELREKLKDVLPPEPPKPAGGGGAKEKVTIEAECPQCGTSPMILRTTGRGPFLGCSKYPKCKGTAKVTPEMAEKIEAAKA